MNKENIIANICMCLYVCRVVCTLFLQFIRFQYLVAKRTQVSVLLSISVPGQRYFYVVIIWCLIFHCSSMDRRNLFTWDGIKMCQVNVFTLCSYSATKSLLILPKQESSSLIYNMNGLCLLV